MANLFEYEKEAIRIKAKRTDVEKEEFRKFSVDPNLTSFEVLQSILCRAFELPTSDISIKYLHVDKSGKEVWTPLLSDWDLDTAILGCAEHGLQLQVRVLETPSLGEMHHGKGLMSPVLEAGQNMAKKTLQEVAAQARAASATQVSMAGAGLQGLVSKSSSQASGFFKRHYEQTLPGLAIKVRTALNLELEGNSANREELQAVTSPPPLSDAQFRKFLNKVGQVVSPREFRLAVYRGGLEPSLRKIAWKHLLNVYPAGMTGGERIRYLRELSQTYAQLKSDWMDLVLQGRITDDVKTVMNMVRKDVLRTDRQHGFYAGEGNHNVTSLFNILTTYALNHPSVSYCQGMSDLASPLLVTMGEESHAYICFAALMTRMKPNFMLDGAAMTTKFQHLSEGLMYYDPEFYTYLKLHMADDLLFCYRWLLLEMKREFPFDTALKALEVTWSSLPPATADTKVELWETRFSPKMSPSSSDLSKPCETPYGKVAAIRKLSVERQISDNSETQPRRQIPDRDPRNRIRSDTSVVERRQLVFNKSQSATNVTKRRAPIPTQKSIKDDPVVVTPMTGSAPDNKDAKNGTTATPPPPVKKLVNLKDFYSLTDQNRKSQVPSGSGNPTPKSSIKTAKDEAVKAGLKEPKRLDTGKKSHSADEDSASPKVQMQQGSPLRANLKGSDMVGVSPCVEAVPPEASPVHEDPFDFVGYSQANAAITIFCNRLPPPTQFGHGNPFLMFLCLSCLLQHRDYIMRSELDYQDIAMYFDRMVRGHDVDRVLMNARRLFAEYLNEDWSPSPQPSTGSQAPSC